MNRPSAELSALPSSADRVDDQLSRLSAELEWIAAVSPVNIEEEWRRFRRSGYGQTPRFKYREQPPLKAYRSRLKSLPCEQIEHPLLRALLVEKQLELSRLVELIDLRGTSGFLSQSIALFGEAEPPLVAIAQQILQELKIAPDEPIKGETLIAQDIPESPDAGEIDGEAKEAKPAATPVPKRSAEPDKPKAQKKPADKKAAELTKSGKSPHFVQPVKEQIVEG